MKFKRITAVLLSIATLAAIPTVPVLRDVLPAASVTAEAADTFVTQFVDNEVMYIAYQDSNGEKYATAIAVYSDATRVKLNATVSYNGVSYPVRKIGPGAFANRDRLVTVDLSQATNLREIGENAFNGSAARFVDINGANQPGTTLTIKQGAFRNTRNMMYTYIYSGVKNLVIEENAFTSSTISDFYCYAKNLTLNSWSFDGAGQYLNFTINSSTDTATIHSSAFASCWMTNLNIFCREITIDKNAFVDPNDGRRYSGIKNLLFGNFTQVISLGEHSVAGLPGLEYVTFSNPNAVLTMGKGAFAYSNLKTINLPNTVTEIPESCFENCRELIVNPVTPYVTTIGPAAFKFATLPQYINISRATTYIAEDAFTYVRGVRAFYVAGDNPNYKSKDDVLMNMNESVLLAYPPLKETKNYTTYAFTIPDGAFYDCKNLESLSLVNLTRPDGETVDFFGMDNLTSLTVPAADYYGHSGAFILDRYHTLFYATKVTKVNGIDMIEAGENGEPRFIEKFRSAIMERLDSNYEYCGFLREYLEQMDSYVVNTFTNDTMTDMEKAVRLQEWIMNRVEYDPNEKEYCRQEDAGLTPDPSLQSQKNHCDSSVYLHYVLNPDDNQYHYYTVCDGYARCYRRLMQRAGIETYYVDAANIDGWDKTGHAWNLVKIGENYYHVDVCWDDGKTGTDRFTHFMRSNATFANTHAQYFNWSIKTFEGDVFCNPPADLRKDSTTAMLFDMSNLGRVKPMTSIDQYAVQRLEQIVAGSAANDYERAAGDINFDGSIDSRDVTLLKQYLLNYKTIYTSVSAWRFSVLAQ